MKVLIKAFLNDESGGAAIEYGLIVAFLGIGIILSLTNIRDGLSALTKTVTDELSSN
jgi:Flp pilus assembly pilin Flp